MSLAFSRLFRSFSFAFFIQIFYQFSFDFIFVSFLFSSSFYLIWFVFSCFFFFFILSPSLSIFPTPVCLSICSFITLFLSLISSFSLLFSLSHLFSFLWLSPFLFPFDLVSFPCRYLVLVSFTFVLTSWTTILRVVLETAFSARRGCRFL